jgi:hypothetical protein
VPELGGLVPDFKLIVDDLVHQADEELKNRPLAVFPKVVLWALRDARVIRRFYDHLVAWSEELGRLVRESPEDAATVMRYILSVAGDEPFDNLRRRIIELVPATEDVMATAAEQLIQRGRAEGKAEGRAEGKAEGRAEGKAEGKAEGRAEGKAEGVLAILEARGIVVGARERTRIIASTDLVELDRWLRRAVTVESVSELFVR